MTLYDFDSEVREAFFELAIERNDKSLLKGAYSTNMEWRNLTDVLGAEIGYEAINRVHDKTMTQVPFKGSEETCQKLSKKYNIKYVSSRYKCYQKQTEDWLYYNEFPNGEVICSTHDKLSHLTDCRYLIDDRPKTIIEFITDFDYKWDLEADVFEAYPVDNYIDPKDRQRKAFGLWTPYNKNLTDINNVYLAPTWRGIAFYLERKGIL